MKKMIVRVDESRKMDRELMETIKRNKDKALMAEEVGSAIDGREVLPLSISIINRLSIKLTNAIKCIKAFPSMKETRTFLGLTRYHKKFIRKYGVVSKLFNNMLRKKKKEEDLLANNS